ncbi:MAG: hydrolase [Nitrospirae bacterium]|nr:MAG: hydrolase [Nitrospirota bacterium]
MNRFRVSADDALLLIIDIQERLAAVMDERETVLKNTTHLIELSKLFNIPVIITEQYPKGLGPTVSELRDALGDYQPIEKVTFSCCGAQGFMDAIRETGRKKVLVTGMETHICVLQTCLDLLEQSLEVWLIADALTSRRDYDKALSLELLRQAGCMVTTTEAVLFQVLKRAGTEEFKIISRRIK